MSSQSVLTLNVVPDDDATSALGLGASRRAYVPRCLGPAGALFAGMRDDLKRRRPHYWSDWRDGWSSKVLSSTLFMVFTSIAPAITFSVVMDEATRVNVVNASASCEEVGAGYGHAYDLEVEARGGPECVSQLGPVEVLFSTALTGVIFAIFGGQPLCILGVTGPVTIFTVFVFEMAKSLQIDFLPFYAWVQIWAAIMHVLLAATNACKHVAIVTRFSCETFGMLIALIYIYTGAVNLAEYAVYSLSPSICNTTPPCLAGRAC